MVKKRASKYVHSISREEIRGQNSQNGREGGEGGEGRKC
jgi:hypothetical protein